MLAFHNCEKLEQFKRLCLGLGLEEDPNYYSLTTYIIKFTDNSF